MCGIVGIIGREPVAPRMVDALKRLEYRGYDSAGVATLEGGADRAPPRRGQARQSRDEARACEPLDGMIGIGHTRWATHGAPTEGNAHPHATDKVAVVHNGIIENFRELLDDLQRTATRRDADRHGVRRALGDPRDERAARPRDGGRRDAQEAARRLRARLHVQGPGEAADRRAPRRAARRRLWRHRDVSRLRRHGAGAVHRAAAYLLDGDWAVLTPKGVTIRDDSDAIVRRETLVSQPRRR